MTRTFGFAAAAFAVSLTAAAFAQDETAPKPAKEKKICRIEQVTGSNMPKRTCRTQAEWDALAKAQDEYNQRHMSNLRGASVSRN